MSKFTDENESKATGTATTLPDASGLSSSPLLLSFSLSHGLYTVLEALALMSGESKQQENLLFCLPIQLTNQPTHQLADQVQMNTASLLRASTSGNFQS